MNGFLMITYLAHLEDKKSKENKPFVAVSKDSKLLGKYNVQIYFGECETLFQDIPAADALAAIRVVMNLHLKSWNVIIQNEV